MYDPAIGRFTSADTIVPGGVQGLDRYAYVNNSPVRYTDPSGHSYCDSQYAFKEDCAGDASLGGQYNDPVSLSKRAQQLIDFAESVGMTPEDVIGIGLGHEMFGNPKKADRDTQMEAFRNGFLRYANEHCNGNPTYNCMLNYFAGSYQSVYGQFIDKDGNPTIFWGKPEKYEFAQAGRNLGDGNKAAVQLGIEFMGDFMDTISSYSYDPVNNPADWYLPLNSGVVDAQALNVALGGKPTRETGFLVIISATCPSTGAAGYTLVYNLFGEKALDKAGLKTC
jgi:hypothetical protein